MLQTFRGRWRVVAGFAGALISIAALNLAMVSSVIDISPQIMKMDQSQSAKTSENQNDLALSTMSDLTETLERPIFSPSRKDFVEPPPPLEISEPASQPVSPQAAPIAAPSIKFQGTWLVADSASVLISLNGGTAEWFVEGDTIEGWKIAQITADRMYLAHGSDKVAFSLYDLDGVPK
jgi:hypothetical protein